MEEGESLSPLISPVLLVRLSSLNTGFIDVPTVPTTFYFHSLRPTLRECMQAPSDLHPSIEPALRSPLLIRPVPIRLLMKQGSSIDNRTVTSSVDLITIRIFAGPDLLTGDY